MNRYKTPFSTILIHFQLIDTSTEGSYFYNNYYNNNITIITNVFHCFESDAQTLPGTEKQ